jgi:putative ABC transport system permease protein
MMVIRALVLRPMLRETLRTLLTICGIAVGVAVVVAIALSNQSALRAFRESVDAVSGRANYQIASNAPLDETLLLKLQPLWRRGVRFAPVIDVEGVVQPSQIPIRLLAVDLLSDIHFRDYRYAEILSGGQPPTAVVYLDLFRDDSIILPLSFAQEHQLRLGSPITLNILGHEATMIVRGLLEARGPATAFNGSIGIADIATAQKRFGMLGTVTRVDLLVPDDSVLPEIRRVLPQGARLERPSRRNERVEKMLRAFRVNLFALAGVALLVGMFLVYNTVLISILRRRKDVGILKTLGVSPRQIFVAFLIEGLLFGAIGSVAGIALGDALAFAILRTISQTVNALYIASRPESIVLTRGIIAAGVLVGMVLSLLSAIQPSIEAAKVRPNFLIQPGLQQRVRVARQRIFAIAAIFAFALAAVACVLPPVNGFAIGGYIGVLFVVIAFSLLAPGILTLVTLLLVKPLRAIYGTIGQLASASLPASLRRTAVATAALALATGMMIAVALMVGSFRETVRLWVNQTVSSDLWLRPAKLLSNADAAVFPPSIGEELKHVPFIEAIDRVRGRDMIYRDSIIAVGSGDFDVAARRGTLPMVTPRSEEAALEEAIRRGGVVVSETFAMKFKKRVGDSVALPAANGIEQFPITGIYRDYSNDRGVVVMDRSRYVKAFGDDAINTIIIYLRKGVTPEDARTRLESMFGPKYHAFTVTNREIRTEVMRIFDQTFVITYALLAVAIIVAILGIVNTLTALILERTRELALLRVMGMTIAEVRRMILLESSILALTSTAIGIAMGYVLSWILIYVINKQSFGWTIEFHAPVRTIVISCAITTLAAVVAGVIPSRLAARIDLAAAVKTE